MKRPAFQFYPGDWQRDTALRSCSIGARGLWIEMMCIMHQADPYGFLVLNGKSIGAAQLGRMVGASDKEVRRSQSELEAAGVYSLDEEGRMFSRRMVRDEQLRQVRADGGKGGGEYGLLGKDHGVKGGRPVTKTGDKKPPFHEANKPPSEPPPSSSVFSLQSSTSDPEASSVDGVDPTGADGKAALPAHVKVATWLRDPALKMFGVKADDPRVFQLAKEGTTKVEIDEAVRIARTDRGKGEKPFHFSYILGIISDLRNPPERTSTPQWWATDQGIQAKGREIGLTALAGESWPQFRERINTKLAEVSRGTQAAA